MTTGEVLAPLLDQPTRTAIVSDYDGTLSPVVDDPDRAAPLAGTEEVLTDLAGIFGVVAIVSGRRLSFLLDQLVGVPTTVRMAGLYGLEQRAPDGSIVVEPATERLYSSEPNAA